MDPMYVTYFEEMDELLQRAEACLIRLESGSSSDDINELFRIAHSIKGSSQMIGFDPIGNLTHKLEDLLDSVRKEKIRLDSDVLRLCFDALDQVGTMAESKRANFDEDFDRDAISAADRLGAEIAQWLGQQSEPDGGGRGAGQPGGGIVGALKEAKNPAGRRYYIAVRISDDAPMVQAVLFTIFHNIREIGSLEYSTVSDDDIFGASGDRPIASCEMILNTDLEAAELYPLLEVMYVDGVEIVDLSEGTLHERAVPADRRSLAFFGNVFDALGKLHPMLFRGRMANAAKLAETLRAQWAGIAAEAGGLPTGAALPAIERFYGQSLLLLDGNAKIRREVADHLRREFTDLLETVYGHVRGRLIFQIVKARDGQFRKRLADAVERMDRSRVRRLFVDVSGLSAMDGDDLAELVAVKRSLGGAGISVGIIAGRPMNKRMVNLFDAIRPVENFGVYGTEHDAVLGRSREISNGERDGEMDNCNVMILDGKEASAALRNLLESAGFRRIDAFSDATEAMAAFRDKKYHIVLADMDAPGMDGLEFLARVRQYDPMTQVIMMAEAAPVDRVLGCLELGAGDYVPKPFRSEQAVTEAVAQSVRKLERWKEAIRETVIRRTETADGEQNI